MLFHSIRKRCARAKKRLRHHDAEITAQAAEQALPDLAMLRQELAHALERADRHQHATLAAYGLDRGDKPFDPVASHSARGLRFFAGLALAVELVAAAGIGVAAYGGWLGALAGIALAAMLAAGFLGLLIWKIPTTPPALAIARLRQWLGVSSIGLIGSLLGLFAVRFLSCGGADLLFSSSAAAISVSVASLAASAWKLAMLVEAPYKALTQKQELEIALRDIEAHLQLAESIAAKRRAQAARPMQVKEATGGYGQALRAIALILLVLLPLPVRAEAFRLYVDGSGSLNLGAWQAVREVLADPAPIADVLGADRVEAAIFYDYAQSWSKAHDGWSWTSLAVDAAECAPEGIFEQLHKSAGSAETAACLTEKRKRRRQMRQTSAAAFAEQLTAFDIATPREATCLFSLLNRLLHERGGAAVVVTDGQDEGCGTTPPLEAARGQKVIVVLLPDQQLDSDNEARLHARREALETRYPFPELHVIDGRALIHDTVDWAAWLKTGR